MQCKTAKIPTIVIEYIKMEPKLSKDAISTNIYDNKLIARSCKKKKKLGKSVPHEWRLS